MTGLRDRLRRWKLRRKTPSEIFTRYWHRNKWGDSDSRSGKGSNLAATETLRQQLPGFIAPLGIRSFLDERKQNAVTSSFQSRNTKAEGGRVLNADSTRRQVTSGFR